MRYSLDPLFCCAAETESVLFKINSSLGFIWRKLCDVINQLKQTSCSTFLNWTQSHLNVPGKHWNLIKMITVLNVKSTLNFRKTGLTHLLLLSFWCHVFNICSSKSALKIKGKSITFRCWLYFPEISLKIVQDLSNEQQKPWKMQSLDWP